MASLAAVAPVTVSISPSCVMSWKTRWDTFVERVGEAVLLVEPAVLGLRHRRHHDERPVAQVRECTRRIEDAIEPRELLAEARRGPRGGLEGAPARSDVRGQVVRRDRRQESGDADACEARQHPREGAHLVLEGWPADCAGVMCGDCASSSTTPATSLGYAAAKKRT